MVASSNGNDGTSWSCSPARAAPAPATVPALASAPAAPAVPDALRKLLRLIRSGMTVLLGTWPNAASGVLSIMQPLAWFVLQQVVQRLLRLALGPGDQVVEARGLLAAGHGLGQGVVVAAVAAGDQQIVEGRPRLALQPQADGGQGGRLAGLQPVAVVQLGQGPRGPFPQLPVGGAGRV